MYERRLKVLLGLMALSVAVLLVRLVDLQLIRGDAYRARAQEKLVRAKLLATVRGQLLDRRGRVLAIDRPCYEFCLPYAMLKGPGQTPEDRKFYARWVRGRIGRIVSDENLDLSQARALFQQRLDRTWEVASEVTGVGANEVHLAAEEVVRRIEVIRRRVGGRIREEYQSHPVIGELDEAEAVELRCRMAEMIGSAMVRPANRRWYPYGREACHVVGRVGPVDATEVTPENELAALPLKQRMTHYLHGDRIGKFGAEKLCEPMLRGVRGYRKGRLTGERLEDVPPWFGGSCRLTLDMDLQRAVREAFLARNPARQGAVVVLNVFDDEANGLIAGEVLAMVSCPTYDPNAYYRDYERLSSDAVNLPLWNRAVAVRYPPGSTFKPLAAMAALRANVIGPDTTFHCQGYLHTPDAFRCWLWKRARTGHGSLALVEALERSCNVFFFNVGELLGVRRQVAWLTMLGFAKPPGTGLPEERAGKLPDPRRDHLPGEARFLAFGQGKVAVTPLHVANAMATIARGGLLITPLLVRELAHKQKRLRIGLSPAHAELVQRGMFKVVNSTSGTAYRHAYLADVEICGKTGTAETEPRRIDSNGNGRIDRRDRVVRSGDTAWFAGFAPYRKPKIAFVVVSEYSDKSGGETCGPIARDVVRICKKLGYL